MMKNIFGGAAKRKNLVTGETLTSEPSLLAVRGWRGNGESRTTFNVKLLPHSYAVFEIEK